MKKLALLFLLILLCVNLQAQSARSKTKDVYITKNGNSTILGLNMGYPCPPLCGGYSATGDLGITLIDKGDKGFEVA